MECMCSILDRVPALTGRGGDGRENDGKDLVTTGGSRYRVLDWRHVRTTQALQVFEAAVAQQLSCAPVEIAQHRFGQDSDRVVSAATQSTAPLREAAASVLDARLSIDAVMGALETMGATMQRDHVINMVRACFSQ
jgi:hypothetical protein